MPDEVNYGLVEPFDVDDGSLDGFSPQEIFCFGVEWEMFRQKLKDTPRSFTEQIHSANVQRLLAMCKRHERSAIRRLVGDDYMDWCLLDVGPAPDGA